VEVSFSLDIVRRLENASTGNISYRIYYNLKQMVRLIAAQDVPTVWIVVHLILDIYARTGAFDGQWFRCGR
jgi:DNA polymerase II large subunit